MDRLTEKINEYDYKLIKYNDIVRANARLKLGKYEDIFELIEEMYKKPVGWKANSGNVYYENYTDSTILYNPKTNEIEIYEYEFMASYKVEEYGITWWLKEGKSE